jgi:exopolysaccharide biosynthesis protein
VLVLDPRQAAVEVRPALANEHLQARERVSQICAREGAIAGINGGFFAGNGQPLGLVVVGGEFIVAPSRVRTALIINRDGSLQIAQVALAGRVTLPRLGTYALTSINEGHESGDQLILYTRRFAETLEGNDRTTRIALDRGGTVKQVLARSAAPLDIPEGGVALSGKGVFVDRLARLAAGDRVVVQLATQPSFRNATHILGAGPRLLKNGRIAITSEEERFRPDVATGAAARTAFGLMADGRAILVTVDRRAGFAAGAGSAAGAASGSTGMTLWELAKTMQQLGAHDAMNFDGGGSSTMVVASHIVNNPSDGASRRVADALLVFAPPAALGLVGP